MKVRGGINRKLFYGICSDQDRSRRECRKKICVGRTPPTHIFFNIRSICNLPPVEFKYPRIVRTFLKNFFLGCNGQRPKALQALFLIPREVDQAGKVRNDKSV